MRRRLRDEVIRRWLSDSAVVLEALAERFEVSPKTETNYGTVAATIRQAAEKLRELPYDDR